MAHLCYFGTDWLVFCQYLLKVLCVELSAVKISRMLLAILIFIAIFLAYVHCLAISQDFSRITVIR